MKTTTILKSTLFLGLAAAIGFAQSPARKSGWVPIPKTTTPTGKPGAALIAAVTAAKRVNPADRGSLQDRVALQQALPGTWLIHVTPGGADAPPPFISLGSFSSDGNFIETESDAMAPPAGTPGQGVWAAAPARGFDLTFYGFLFDGENFAGMIKVSGHAQLDQGLASFKGTYKAEFFDPSGTFLFGGPGVLQGTRLEVEPN
jgi:hypothetical protein